MSKEAPKMKVTVVAKQASRMRAGFQFTSAPTDVEVTEAQLEAIKADPLLAVVETPKADKKSEDKK